MSALIPHAARQMGDQVIQTVDGRHIHAFLGIAKDYSDWVKRQIKSGQLIEDRDFVIFYHKGENHPGRPSIEYHFTFRAAEHIGMMSRTAKGREVREYFLDLEEQAQQHAIQTKATPAEAALAIAQAVLSIERRQVAIEARQDAHAAQLSAQAAALAALTARQPPVGKHRPEAWLRAQGKPYLPREVLAAFRRECRRLEAPETFRPDGYDYPAAYYGPETLARAYETTTRQLSFLGQEPVPGGWRRQRS